MNVIVVVRLNLITFIPKHKILIKPLKRLKHITLRQLKLTLLRQLVSTLGLVFNRLRLQLIQLNRIKFVLMKLKYVHWTVLNWVLSRSVVLKSNQRTNCNWSRI